MDPLSGSALRRLTPSPAGATVAVRSRALLALWRFLRWPWLLVMLSGLALVLLVLSRWLPQLPGQIGLDPAGAARWLLITTENHGPLGSLLHDMGLFDFRHSLLLRALISSLGFLLLLHLADQLDAWRLVQQIPRRVRQEWTEPGQPLALDGTLFLYRVRHIVDGPVPTVDETLSRELTGRGVSLRRQIVGPVVADVTEIGSEEREAAADPEVRLWVTPRSGTLALRLLALVGLLTGLIGFGLAAMYGWSVGVDRLVPGSTFQVSPYGLSLGYDIAGLADGGTAGLTVAVGGRSTQMALGGRRQVRLDGVSVTVQPDVPAMAVVTDSPLLALAGQSQGRSQLGLLFPGPGSEELVTLPDREMALRIIRLPDGEESFLVEHFVGSDVQPVQRLELHDGNPVTVDMRDAGLEVTLIPTPSLQVQARSQTGEWLLWAGLAMAAAGVFGFLRPMTVLVIQLGAWSTGQTVLVAQTNRVELTRDLAVVGVDEP